MDYIQETHVWKIKGCFIVVTRELHKGSYMTITTVAQVSTATIFIGLSPAGSSNSVLLQDIQIDRYMSLFMRLVRQQLFMRKCGLAISSKSLTFSQNKVYHP